MTLSLVIGRHGTDRVKNCSSDAHDNRTTYRTCVSFDGIVECTHDAYGKLTSVSTISALQHIT